MILNYIYQKEFQKINTKACSKIDVMYEIKISEDIQDKVYACSDYVMNIIRDTCNNLLIEK